MRLPPQPEDTSDALRLGLIRYPQGNETFRSRTGEAKPYIFDTRGAGSIVELRELIVRLAIRQLNEVSLAEVIGGISKSGTTWGAWIAWACRLPFANILLDGPRASGAQREVEGDVRSRNVVLIDNWVRSGESINTAIDVVRRSGGRVVGVIVVVALTELTLDAPLFPIWYISELAPPKADQQS